MTDWDPEKNVRGEGTSFPVFHRQTQRDTHRDTGQTPRNTDRHKHINTKKQSLQAQQEGIKVDRTNPTNYLKMFN